MENCGHLGHATPVSVLWGGGEVGWGVWGGVCGVGCVGWGVCAAAAVAKRPRVLARLCFVLSTPALADLSEAGGEWLAL